MSDTLGRAEEFLRSEIGPRANDIDSDPEELRGALRGLCDRSLMALRRPDEYGGPALGEAEFRQFQESVARYSGSLAFLQTQHQSAGSMIARSENSDLKSAYLPRMANGERLVGIGFSQLRRAGSPVMRADRTHGGYVLQGTVPWITGWTFYPEFLIGATLPGGEAVFGIVPFTEQEGIRLSPPMKLAAMESALTVSGEFDGWLLRDELVAFVKPARWIKNNDMINITLQGHFALGCARAGLDILERAAESKPFPFIRDAYAALDVELNLCREATASAQPSAGEESTQERLAIRAWAIDLAVRCAHAAVAGSSGAANSLRHPAQRVYREALVYTVSAQTPEIMEATLQRLVRNDSLSGV
ncbi:MAG TPA: acyl-CoA dehydrogenase family protein [Fimbriimonadaceae bacterium]|nr:acyl-CoA dehydrogenase family protein [Fimbriimonadaceae bacterium]